MINIRPCSALVLLLLLFHVSGAGAALWGDKDPEIDIRYGRHNDYQRVVIEGPHDFITTAQVEHSDTQVRVTFASNNFSLKDITLPITYNRDKNILVFQQDTAGSIKLRKLLDPSRLVIDYYPGKETSDQKKDDKASPDAADRKPEVARSISSKEEKNISQSQQIKKQQKKRALSKVKKKSVKHKIEEKKGGKEATIDVRYGRHNDYQRVVIEGPLDFIETAQVKHSDRHVRVVFASQDFSLKDSNLPIILRRDKNVLIFQQDSIDTIRHRNLSGPSRLVIDFYSGKKSPDQHKDAHLNVAEVKTEVAGTGPEMTEKDKTQSEADIKDQDQRVPTEFKKETVSNEKPEMHTVRPANTAEKKASDKKDIAKDKKKDETDFVPEQYKKLWTLLETGNHYGLLSALPEYKPENAGSVAVYHYMFGAASFSAKKYLNAIEHLRLAYIYSTNRRLKEKALSLRAQTYLTIKLYQEARADYMMLIETFPSSKKIRKAHLGLADSLSKLGLYRQAIKEYDKAGDDAVILYRKANALQRLERVEEASEYYRKAKLSDSTYPETSPETYYLLGENMRMSGELILAKHHMSNIVSGPYRDSANISLGLIYLKEGNITEAINKFIMATHAEDRKTKISALFNLALAKLKAGKVTEATAHLETIRYDHVDSFIYKDTLLALAKIYRKEKQTKRSLSLLKELVYGKHPPQDAFNELENIILDSLDETDKKDSDTMNVADIWKEVGQWLVHEKREEFLVTVSESLRNYRMPFIELSGWLIDNASQGTRGRVALNLAEYYAGIGEISMAKMYMTMAMNKQLPPDDVLRVEVKILSASGKRKMAMDRLVEIEHIEKEDIVMLGNIMFDIRNPKSATVQKGIEFYKKALAESDWDADAYIRLADILDASGRGSEAAKYYRIAYTKNPEDEWAIYRIGRWSDRNESEKMFSILQNGDSLLSRVAKTELTRINILNKVNEVF